MALSVFKVGKLKKVMALRVKYALFYSPFLEFLRDHLTRFFTYAIR